MTALADALSDPGPTEHYSPRAIEAFVEVSDLVTRLRAHTSEPISDFIARAVRERGGDVEAALAGPSGTSTSALDDFHALAASVTEIDGRPKPLNRFAARRTALRRPNSYHIK